MNRIHEYALDAAILLVLPGVSLAHHGSPDELGGRLVHAMYDPSHLGVTLLVAGALMVAYRLFVRARRRQ